MAGTLINQDTPMDQATLTLPHQYAAGIEHLFVNGVHSIKNRVHTSDRGGVSLRSNACAAARYAPFSHGGSKRWANW